MVWQNEREQGIFWLVVVGINEPREEGRGDKGARLCGPYLQGDLLGGQHARQPIIDLSRLSNMYICFLLY